MAEPVPQVYACIAAVSGEIALTGIAKSRKNVQQNYSFRGIDELFNVLAPLLAKHKLVILPRVLNRTCTERVSKSGTVQFFVVVEAEFDYVAAGDGSSHTVRTIGEAQDSADKATNKAMSAAYKYAAFQTFCIPTEGDTLDADATTPEPTVATVVTPAFLTSDAPAGYGEMLTDLTAAADEGTAALMAGWNKTRQEYRRHLSATGAWETLKARAAKVRPAVSA